MTKKPRNRNAQDITLIQLHALKKRVTNLERFRKDDKRRIDLLEHGATQLAIAIRKLQGQR